ncbi:MAG: hypothetical protein KJ970_14005 [Candidatus Eisenbacteria bacterium]|uniref:Uncharacterized protein n=1 Tax=Eiseniibacteriota bacterium TaxID=2212470 RepID=A0A948S1C2_UNCEI|nr:hypothetical protein [Candidatus Eisenbacteria bacterium]MBU2692029.1 hypothetical protein [Candidatus Eisenbacteria bacterium]
MWRRTLISCLSLYFLVHSGCGGREKLTSDDGSGDPALPEWVYGESQVYDAPAAPGGRILDPLSGQTFRFPAGGSGLLTVLQLESGPRTASDEGAFEITYEGSGSLELLIDHDPEDVDFLVGYLPLDYAVQEGEELDTSGWLPLGSTAGQGDTLVFELPVGAKMTGSMSLPWS